jgi:hypothetical protein
MIIGEKIGIQATSRYGTLYERHSSPFSAANPMAKNCILQTN